eukprot:1073660-Amphidinium_carterae.1
MDSSCDRAGATIRVVAYGDVLVHAKDAQPAGAIQQACIAQLGLQSTNIYFYQWQSPPSLKGPSQPEINSKLTRFDPNQLEM